MHYVRKEVELKFINAAGEEMKFIVVKKGSRKIRGKHFLLANKGY